MTLKWWCIQHTAQISLYVISGCLQHWSMIWEAGSLKVIWRSFTKSRKFWLATRDKISQNDWRKLGRKAGTVYYKSGKILEKEGTIRMILNVKMTCNRFQYSFSFLTFSRPFSVGVGEPSFTKLSTSQLVFYLQKWLSACWMRLELWKMCALKVLR